MKVKLDKPDCLCNTSQHSLIRVWQQHNTTQSSTTQHNIDKQYCLCIKSIYNYSLIQVYLVQLSQWSEQTNNSNTKCVYSFIHCILFCICPRWCSIKGGRAMTAIRGSHQCYQWTFHNYIPLWQDKQSSKFLCSFSCRQENMKAKDICKIFVRYLQKKIDGIISKLWINKSHN